MPRTDDREAIWRLRATKGNVATLVLPRDDPEVLRVVISKASTGARYDIQLNQPRLRIESARGYRLAFRARSDGPRSISFGLAQAHEPWDGLGLYEEVELTTEWQAFEVEFTSAAADEDARIHFDLGGNDLPVELSSLTLRTTPDGTAVEPVLGAWQHYPADRWQYSAGQPALAGRNEQQRFSVVIPTFQRRDIIVRTVQALAHQRFEGTFEVIVVVDGSSDGTADTLRGLRTPFPLTVLEQPNAGAAAARNRGASVAGGEILLFLDDDMEAHPRLLAEHDRSHREGATVVVGHLPLHPDSPATFLSSGIKLWAEGRGQRLSSPGASLGLHDLLTGQISMSRALFQRVDGFDKGFTRGGTFGNEDIDLGHRLVRLGCNVRFTPYAISYQNYVVRPAHYLRQSRQAGRADVALARKHAELAETIFAVREPNDAINRRLWRPFAALSPLTLPLMVTLRWLALALVGLGLEGPRVVRFFYRVHAMEYWRGVAEAGGMPRPRPLRVLSYHAIRDLAGAPVIEAYGMPPDSFRRQLSVLLRAGFQFINPDEFLCFVHSGGGLPRRPLLLTFDDAYEELPDVVLPILQALDIPAVVFAVSGRLGGTNDWDEALGAPPLKLLDADGLQVLARGGLEIGGHSRNHRLLVSVPDQELQAEVEGSLDDLVQAGLGRPRLFAYPYGSCDERVRGAVGSAGLRAAFTVDPGRVRPGHDPYRIPRIEILRGDMGWRFLWKVVTAGRWSRSS